MTHVSVLIRLSLLALIFAVSFVESRDTRLFGKTEDTSKKWVKWYDTLDGKRGEDTNFDLITVPDPFW